MKRIKRAICFVMICILLACGLSSYAQCSDYVKVFENDFESGNMKIWDRIDGTAYFTQTDAPHGISMAMNMDSDVMLWKYFDNTDNSDVFYLSFDVNPEYQYINSYFKLLSKKVSSISGDNEKYVIEPFFVRLDPLKDFHIGFLRDPNDWDAPDGMVNEFKYTPQKWYKVEMWLDLPHRSIYCYLDGEYRGRTGIPEEFDNLCGMVWKSTRRDVSHYFLKTPAKGKPELWLDNFKIMGFTGEDAPYEKSGGNIPEQFTKKLNIKFSSTPGNINFEAKSTFFDVEFVNSSFMESDYNVTCVVTDEGDNVLWEAKEEISLKGNESVKKHHEPKGDFKYGFYKFKVTATHKQSGKVYEKMQRFSNLHTPPEGVKNKKVGFNNHQGQLHGDPAIKFPIESRIGMSITRDSMWWSDFEKEPHVYKTDDVYETWVKEAQKNGIEIMHAFTYSNPVRTPENPPRSPEALQAFGEFVYEWVKTGKGRISYYEVWNEYNATFSIFNPDGGTPEDYFNLLKVSYTNAKKANPDIPIIGIDSARFDEDFTRRVFKAGGGDYLDIVSFHPYPQNFASSPEEGRVAETTIALRNIMKEYGIGEKPLWLTELGFSSGEGYMSEADQANYVIRSMAITDELVERIIWYVSQNKIVNDKLEANFGFIRAWEGIDVPYEAKPALLAMSNWNALMTDAVTEEKYDFEDCLKAYRFKRSDGSKAYVLWSTKDAKNAALKLGAESAQLYDLYGNRTDLSALDGAFNLRITQEPIYLIGDFTEFTVTENKINPEISDTLKLSANDTANILITNKSEKTLFAKAELPKNIIAVSGDILKRGKNNAWQIRTENNPAEASFVLLDITDGEKTYMHIKVPVEYVNAVNTFLRVLPSGSRWQGVMTMKNNTNTQKIGASFSVNEPYVIAEKIKGIQIPQLQPGEERTIKFNIPDSYAEDKIDLKGNILFDNGEVTYLSRAANLYPIVYCKEKPKIDGIIENGEWGDRVINIRGEKHNKNIAGWKDDADLSADAYVMWDKDNFYLAANVKDDIYGYDVGQERTWAGDSVQFAVSPEHTANSRHTEIAIGIVNGKQRVRRYSYRGDSISDSADTLLQNKGNAEFAATRLSDSTVYEFRIGWEELMPEGYNPAMYETLNFSMLINDNDGNGRRGWFEFGSGIGTGKDPSLFLELPFASKNQ